MNDLAQADTHALHAVRRRCVYCLRNTILRPEQILVRGDHFYLCAPRGQIVEGYLAIAPFDCIGCLSRLPGGWFDELDGLLRLVAAFYQEAYGVGPPTCYEQGRAGGGAMIDADGGYPHHAHLCCLPLHLDLHTMLARRFRAVAVDAPRDLASACGNEPYLYAEGITAGAGYERRAYLARSEADRAELERMRLKPVIASLLEKPERGHWSSYPGDAERERATLRFKTFLRCRHSNHR
jgi:hypothetical protein